MDFATMKAELSEAIAESGTRTYSTAQRERWINLGVVDVCRKTLCLQKTVTKNVVALTRIYKVQADWALADFLEFSKEGVLYDDNSATANNRKFLRLQRKTVEWLDENISGWRSVGTNNQSNDPEYYARLGIEDVYIQPVPKTAVTNGFIVNYHYYPIQGTTFGGLVVGTDNPFDNAPWMYPYHHLPVLYATYRALFKAGVPKKDAALAEYVAGLREVKVQLGMGGETAAPDYEARPRVYSYRPR